jgi:hypothetical protein
MEGGGRQIKGEGRKRKGGGRKWEGGGSEIGRERGSMSTPTISV